MRTCNSCGESKPLSSYSRFKKRNGSYGHRYKCIWCGNAKKRRETPMRGSSVRNDATREKRCSKCREWKPFAEFHPRSGERSYGLRARCRACERIDSQAYVAANRDRVNAKKRERPKNSEQERRWKIGTWARKLGMDPEELHAYIDSHGEQCEICGSPRNGKSLHIDHCHTSRRFRGLLCSDCNLGLGKFKDNPEFLRRAVDYIGKVGL